MLLFFSRSSFSSLIKEEANIFLFFSPVILIVYRRPKAENPPPFPTHYPEDLKEDEMNLKQAYDPNIHQPSDPTIVYQESDSVKKEIRTGAKLAKVRTKK